MKVFDMDGQLVVGKVEDSIGICSEGGGGAVVNPATKQVADIPVYLCAVLPGGNITGIRDALHSGHNRSGWYAEFVSRGRKDSSALAAAALPSILGTWWWLPLMGLLAMAVVS